LEQQMVSIADAAKFLGVSRGTIYRWAKNGLLDIVKIGGTSRINKASLLKLTNESNSIYTKQDEKNKLK